MFTEQATFFYKFIAVGSCMGQFMLTSEKETIMCLHYLSENVILHANLLKSRAHGHMCR